MANTPSETLGQIVMDMHKMTRCGETADARTLAAAIRALAEAVLSLHAPVSAPDVTGSGIRTVTQKGRA